MFGLGGGGDAKPTDNPFFGTVESKKSDPNSISSIFGKLGIDLNFLKDFQNLMKMLDGLKGLTDANSLLDLLKKQFGNQFDALMKMGMDTVFASMQFLEEFGAGVLNEIYASLLSQIYIPDELFKTTLMGLHNANSDINYSSGYIRNTVLRHDMPITLEWIDSINKKSYELNTARDAYTAARAGAYHVADYIVGKVWAAYREFRTTYVDPNNKSAVKEFENIKLRYQEFFHMVIKYIIVYSYDNFTEKEISDMVRKYEIEPSAFGENDKKFGKRVMISGDEIDVIAKFVNSGAIATLNNGVLNSRGREKIKYIEVRNMRIKWIYVYLVSKELHNKTYMVHKRLYERLKYPQMNTLTRNLNKAGKGLLEKGLGKAILDGIAALDAAAYNYTKTVEQYLFDPRKQKYANFEDRTIPTPLTEPVAAAPVPPAIDSTKVNGLDFSKYMVKIESELGANSGAITRAVYDLVSGRTYTRFDTFPTTKIVYVENSPVALVETFYIFSKFDTNGTPDEVSSANLKKVIINYLIDRYTPELFTNLQTIYPDLASEFGTTLEDNVLPGILLSSIGFTSLDSLGEAILSAIDKGAISLTGLTYNGHPVTKANFIDWFKATYITKFTNGTLPDTSTTPETSRLNAIVDSTGVTRTMDLSKVVIPDTVAQSVVNNTLYNGAGLTTAQLSERLNTVVIPGAGTTTYPVARLDQYIQSAVTNYGDAVRAASTVYEVLYVIYYTVRADGSVIPRADLEAQGIRTISRQVSPVGSLASTLPRDIGSIVGEVPRSQPVDLNDVPLALLYDPDDDTQSNEPAAIIAARRMVEEDAGNARNGNMVQGSFDSTLAARIIEASAELTEILVERIKANLVDIDIIREIVLFNVGDSAQVHRVQPVRILKQIKVSLLNFKKDVETLSGDPNYDPTVVDRIGEIVSVIDRLTSDVQSLGTVLKSRISGQNTPKEYVVAFNNKNPLDPKLVFVPKEYIPLYIYAEYFRPQ